MKTFIVLCGLVVVSFATPTTILDAQWHQYKLTHGKTYENIEMESSRYGMFNENLKEIEEHNKLYEQGFVTYKKGVNQFTDWTHEEFISYLTKFPRTERKRNGTFERPLNVELPSAIDWREKGAVTYVKDQKQCGSCWAFSATGSIEGQNAIKNKQLVALSEQELVSCALGNGCRGGIMDAAFEYVKQYGLASEKSYLYIATDILPCLSFLTSRAVHISAYHDILPVDERNVEAAVATIGPVSIAVDATYWSQYSSGIYTGRCKSDMHSLNHGVLAVGYGTENGQDYWIVKNSWGAGWGENGYIRLPRHQNKCGIATEASYPII